jgi:hypothetical protein
MGPTSYAIHHNSGEYHAGFVSTTSGNWIGIFDPHPHGFLATLPVEVLREMVAWAVYLEHDPAKDTDGEPAGGYDPAKVSITDGEPVPGGAWQASLFAAD